MHNCADRPSNLPELKKPYTAQVIAELDEKKREALEKTWVKVNSDFGSIFSTLLPGTMAKLEPQEGQSFLNGEHPPLGYGVLQRLFFFTFYDYSEKVKFTPGLVARCGDVSPCPKRVHPSQPSFRLDSRGSQVAYPRRGANQTYPQGGFSKDRFLQG